MTLADATSTDDRHDRATGALAGLALGDALGMPTQALSPASITRLYGAVTGLVDASPEQPYAPLAPAGSVTDDTEQAWLLAEQLLDPSPDSGGAGHIEPRALAQALMNWEEDMIDRGSLDLLGPSTKAALEELRAGAEPGTTGRTGTTNGAAMRVTPVGIAYTTGAPAAWEPLFGTGGHACLTAFGQAVRESCLVTHNTIQGFQAAGLVAAAVSHGIDGADTLTAVHLAQATVASLPAQGTWAPNASVLAVASSAVEYAADHAGDDASFLMWVRDHVGTCVESTESIPTALALAVRYRHRPWEGLLAAANLGGDTDTIGAITGAILGATHGVRAFPAQALARVQAVSDLDPGALAARLLRLRRRNDPVEVSQKAGAGRPAHPSGAADPAAHLSGAADPAAHPGGQVGSAGPSVGPAQPVGRVLHLGEVLIDLSMRVPNLPPRGGDVFATSHDMSPGGGFNVLAAVRQWGCDAVYCGALGTGPMARMARAALDSIGVLHAGPTLSTHDTGVSVALTEADGERSFISTAGAETLTPPECYQHLAVGEQDLVYLSGYSLCAPATREGLLRFASSHAGLPPRPDGVPRVLVDASPMVGELDLSDLQALGALRPLWSLSEREAHILTGRLGDQGDAGASGPDGPREAAGALAKYLGSPVLVRAGAQGAWFVDMLDGAPPADPVHVPTVPVTPVDTNGAGDAHAGVLAAALVQGAPLRRALVLANCAGTLSTLTAGPATCPERHSIEQAAGALSKRMSVMTLRQGGMMASQ